jgi:hypothetical protein
MLSRLGGMTNADGDQASKRVNFLAERNSWPLIADSQLCFVTPQLKTALAVWQAQRGARTMPARSDLTLRDLKTVLPNLAFMNIVRDGPRIRFKVRLAGSALDSFVSGAPTGHFIDEAVPTRFAEKWAALWQPTINARTPTRTVGRVEFPNRRYYVSEALFAPLADDGETPDILMIAAYFHAPGHSVTRGDPIAAQLMNELGERAALAMVTA